MALNGPRNDHENPEVNSRFACYWRPTCDGRHEVDQCAHWRNELNGQLGYYYSPNGIYQEFPRNPRLQQNPTGCTMVNLLIYQRQNDQVLVLLVKKRLREKLSTEGNEQQRQLLLTLPSNNPCRPNAPAIETVRRALQSITTDTNLINQLEERHLTKFMFIDASAVYPIEFNGAQVDLLNGNFAANDEVHSIHWFPLANILQQIPVSANYTQAGNGPNALPRFRRDLQVIIRLNDGHTEHRIWSVAGNMLAGIHNHVGLQTFLQQ